MYLTKLVQHAKTSAKNDIQATCEIWIFLEKKNSVNSCPLISEPPFKENQPGPVWEQFREDGISFHQFIESCFIDICLG